MDLTFILTEDCNLRCRYCYQKNFLPTAMPAEIAVAAMRSAISHGASSLALTFFGGEPLLRSDVLFQVLEAARRLERQFRVPTTAKVSTNGVLLDEKAIDQAARLGLFISLSFDGVQASQDLGRVRLDGRGSFDDVSRALRLLVESQRPFAVYSVVTPQNVRWLAESRRYLWNAGARILVNALDYTAHWDRHAVEALKQQFVQIGRFYQDLLRQHEHFHLEPFDSRIAQQTRPADWRQCNPGIGQVTVGPDGTLYGCVEYFYRRKEPLGNAWDWLDPVRVKAMACTRSGLSEECQECGVRERCNHSCACINLRSEACANRPPAALCVTEQETILAVDQLAAHLYRQHVPEFLLRHYSCSYHMLTGIERLLESMGVTHERPQAGAPGL